ncbi:MAG: DUF4399 domain-containing protein [Bacteroidetes bacterium]|nr:DUF4399 domain-containing protein [Bacteroidota bacterium]
MPTKIFVAAALLLGMIACNNSTDSSSTTTTDTAAAAAKTDSSSHEAMHHDTAAANITPLPAVPADAKVFFKNLKEGASVKSPVKVEFGVSGIKLDTAGPIVAGSGHHHLLVDAEDSIPAGTVVKKDSTHLHFGKAQTGTEVTLAPGKHKLTLQYADGIHRSYGAQLSKTVNITVK